MRRIVTLVLGVTALACSDERRVPDRTPPTLVSRIPVPGDASAFVGAGIEATFSEPLDPATVNADTVHVTLGGETIAASVSLRDARTVRVTPEVDVIDQGSVTVELTGGIADVAGNAFEGDAAPWSFQAAAWARFGAPASPAFAASPVASVALDGGVVLGMSGTLGPALVTRWDGAGWETLAPPGAGAVTGRVSASVRYGVWAAGSAAGAPWVACAGTGGWRALTPPATAGDAIDAWWIAHRPEPYLAWLEVRTAPAGVWLVAKAWDGRDGWAGVGEWKVPGPDVVVAAGPDGDAYAAWTDGGEVHVVELEPGGRELPAPIFTASPGSLSLAVTPTRSPSVFLHDPDDGIIVQQWRDDSGAWTYAEAFARPPAGSAVRTALAFGTEPSQASVLAWAAPDDGAAPDAPRRLHVMRSRAGVTERWGPLNTDPERDVAAVALALEGTMPVVAWAEGADLALPAEPLHLLHAARLNWMPSLGGYVPAPVETHDPRYDGACDRLPPVPAP